MRDTKGDRKVIIRRTFVIESVNPVDACTLLVPAKNKEVLRVFDLICEQKADGFERLFSSIYIIAKEEIICFWREPAVFKQS